MEKVQEIIEKNNQTLQNTVSSAINIKKVRFMSAQLSLCWGAYYSSRGEVLSALGYYKQTQKIYQDLELTNTSGYIGVLTYLSVAYITQGNYVEGEKVLLKLKEMYSVQYHGRYNAGYIALLINLSGFYSSIGCK